MGFQNCKVGLGKKMNWKWDWYTPSGPSLKLTVAPIRNNV